MHALLREIVEHMAPCQLRLVHNHSHMLYCVAIMVNSLSDQIHACWGVHLCSCAMKQRLVPLSHTFWPTLWIIIFMAVDSLVGLLWNVLMSKTITSFALVWLYKDNYCPCCLDGGDNPSDKGIVIIFGRPHCGLQLYLQYM